MKVISGLAIACAIATSTLATSVFAQQQQQIPAPIIFSIRAGETLLLHFASSVTNDCTVLWDHFDDIDVLDGPKEVSLDFKPGKGTVNLTASGKVCPYEVEGGNIMISARDIAEPKEANLTFRVNFHLKSGKQWQLLYRYHLLMFPPREAAQSVQVPSKQ
jgi:hypothetical protein